MRHTSFRTPDGVEIAAQEAGNPAGPEIVLIHGFSQCHLSFSHQIASPLAETCRLVSYDIRGHGGSGKPCDPAAYRDARLWADELSGVFDAMGLRRPVIVAWSYGGRILIDYLQAYGSARLAGINVVGSRTRSDPAFLGPENIRHQSRMASPDIAENVAGTIGFLRTCAVRWDQQEFERHLAFNMLVPHTVRGWLGGRDFDADALYAALTIPVLFTHGTEDRVIPFPASRAAHALTPNSRLSVYEGVGHAPFLESTDRFNAELNDFVLRCNDTG
ncbi:MAG: alpha/beta hydrolase [Acidisphaera sp.]|nr:alpha/beta hydrolase [Acidisphaera sp.]